jgi:hypothetical protein
MKAQSIFVSLFFSMLKMPLMKKIITFFISLLIFGMLVYFIIPIVFHFAPHEIAVTEGSDGKQIPLFRTWFETILYAILEFGASMLMLVFIIIARRVYVYFNGEF